MARSTHIAVAGTVGALAALVLGATMPSRALGHPAEDAKPAAPAPDDEILAPPPTYQANSVTVDEHVAHGSRSMRSSALRTARWSAWATCCAASCRRS